MSDQAHKLAQRRAASLRPGTLRIGASLRAKRLLRVMVVDDDPVVRQVVAAVLNREGYEVLTRGEALGTLAVITRERPDIIVLDVNLPGLAGDALARLVSHKGGHLPKVILHSSQPKHELDELARAAGAFGAIEKSDPLEFLEAFESLLEDTILPTSH